MNQKLENSLRKFTNYTVLGGLASLGIAGLTYAMADTPNYSTYGGVNLTRTITIPNTSKIHSEDYERNVRDAGIAAKVGLGAWALAAPFVVYFWRKDWKNPRPGDDSSFEF